MLFLVFGFNGIGASNGTRREIHCLPYVGFLNIQIIPVVSRHFTGRLGNNFYFCSFHGEKEIMPTYAKCMKSASTVKLKRHFVNVFVNVLYQY